MRSFLVPLFTAACFFAAAGTGATQTAQTTSLLALYKTALVEDAQLHEELERLEAVRTEYPIARSALLPQISIDLSRTRFDDQKIVGSFFGGGGAQSRDDYAYSVDSYSLDISQTLFDLEKFRRLNKAESLVAQAEINAQAARQELIMRLIDAYLAVLLAHSNLEYTRAEKKAVARQLDEAEERFRVGLTPRTDAREARAAYDLVEADEIMAINRLDNAKHALAVIVGHDIHHLRVLSPDFPIQQPTPEDPDQWVAAAHKSNLNLLSQKIAVEIAEQEVGAQSAEHWPSLNLFASRNEDDVRGGPSPRTTYNRIWGIRMEMPIFLGGSTYYKTEQARAAYRQSTRKLETEHRESRRLARESYLNVVSSIKRVAALEQALNSAEISLEANEEGFSVGTRTSAEVLLAVRDVYSTKRDLVDARHDYILNTLRLKHAAGSLSDGDVAGIEQWLQ